VTRDRLAHLREAAKVFRIGWWRHLATDADGDVGVVNADVHQFDPDPLISSDLDAPEGVTFLTLTESYREWPKHQTLESVTDGYIATTPIEDVRLRIYQADNDQDLLLVVLRQPAWHNGGAGFGQLAWAGGGRLSTFSLHDFSPSIHRFSDLRHAWDAISTVAHIQIAAPDPRAMSDEDAFEQAVAFGLASTSAILTMRVRLDGRAVTRSTCYQEARHLPEFLRRRAGHDAHESLRIPVSGSGGVSQKWRKSSLEWLADNPTKSPTDFGRPQFTAKRCTGQAAANRWMTEKHFGIRRVQRELAKRIQCPA